MHLLKTDIATNIVIDNQRIETDILLPFITGPKVDNVHVVIRSTGF